MIIKSLNPAILLGFGIFGLAVALIAPLLRGADEAPYTLVSTGLDMSPKGSDWLARGDGRDPARWLAARVSPPAEATHLSAALAEAARHYEETPRMIANRVAQLSDTFPDLDPARLLRDLSMETRGSRSFGALAQHYLVLREQGLGHAAALDALRGNEED